MKALKSWAWISLFLFILMFAACGSGESSSSTGTLSLSLTDATTYEYNAVYVTIKEVQVHKDGDEDSNWKVVVSPNKTYNLLELVNGIREELGITELETCHYTQMRLIIGNEHDNAINILSKSHKYANYIVDHDNYYHELKIPSGFQSGVKIVHGFDINQNQTTELILDFDASRSIVKAGKSEQWLLKPTIKVLNTNEYSIIKGTVKNNSPEEELLKGVMVSAQIFDPSAADEKDQVIVQASTVTNNEGSYTMFLKSGSYNIIGYKDGYNPACAKIDTLSGATYTENFTLSDASTGTIGCNVSIDDGDDDEKYVTVSIRQSAECSASIELKSLNIANGGSDYDISLPEGTYSIVASSYSKDTIVYDNITIEADTYTTIEDIAF